MAVETKEILYMLTDRLCLERNSLAHRVRLQKVLYLIQSYGLVKLGYGFSWYKYGPYSQNLVYDAYEVLNNPQEYQKKTQKYKFNDATERKLQQFCSKFDDILSDAKQLELVASIRYLKKIWYPNMSSENVFDLLKNHKMCFFDNSEIGENQAKEAFRRCVEFTPN